MDRVKLPGRGLRVALRVAWTLAIAVGLFVVVRDASANRVLDALGHADARVLGIAIPVLFGASAIVRSARFGASLATGPPPSRAVRFTGILECVLLSQAANNVLPFRAGELLRTRDLVARGYSLSATVSGQLTEKAVELTTLVVVIVPMLLADPRARGTLRAFVAGIVVFCALAVAAVLWLRASGRTAWIERAIGGLLRRGRPSVLWPAIVWSFVSDAIDVVVVYACLRSLGLPSDVGTCVTVYAGINLAIAVPATPGQIGAMEAGASLALVARGVPNAAAIAFGVVFRVAQSVPALLAGGVLWLRRDLSARFANHGA
jgi:uncharacterized protein (TIRG00374 family)